MIKNDNKTKIEVKNLNLYYGTNQALFDITANLYENKITALIGPSGCGKSTFLRCINRMNDLIPIVKIDGKIIQELWELCVTHGYPSAESAECFLSRWLVTHRILIEAYDLFRERDSSTILQRLEELEKACRDSQDIMGYNDSKLTLTSKDLKNGLGT